MGYPKFEPMQFVYEYDFAVSGGAQGNINLDCVGHNALSTDTIIQGITIYVETGLAGSATPTITMGHAGDRDGYFQNFYSLATTGAVIRLGEVAGDLVWDDTNDHEIAYKPNSAENAVPSITIGTQNLTAGKFKVVFEAIRMA